MVFSEWGSLTRTGTIYIYHTCEGVRGGKKGVEGVEEKEGPKPKPS